MSKKAQEPNISPELIAEMKARITQVERFREKTFEIFRLWTKWAKINHPDWQPEVEHEQDIIDDMISNFEKAIDSLFRKEKKYSEDYSNGFIGGYAFGSLTVEWSVRYLPKSPIYKEAVWLKSLRQYFEVHTEAAMHVNRLYTHIERSDMLFKKNKDDDYDDYYTFVADENFDHQRKDLIDLLHKLEFEYLTKFVEDQEHIEPCGMHDIITDEDRRFILGY